MDEPTVAPPVEDPPAVDPPTSDPPGDPEPETVQMTRQEAEALRREVAESRRRAKKAEEDRSKQQGEWQKLAEERERERDEAAAKLADYERKQRVSKIATDLNFRDPDDVYHRLSPEEQDDPKLTESALKRIAKDKAYLVVPPSDPPRVPGQVLKPGVERDDRSEDHPSKLAEQVPRGW